MNFGKRVVIEPVNHKTNPRADPREDIELQQVMAEVFDLVDKVVRRMSSVYVADVAETVSRLSRYRVVIR